MPRTPLQKILAQYRATSQTEREKGSYFEELIRTYFRFEASYADLYSDVWLFADWAKEIGTPEFGISAKDTGIDLVAKTRGTEEYHAIQCKCYDEHHRIMRRDIDSFFTASGRTPFTQRIIVTTTNDWSEHAEDALLKQQPPVLKIDLQDLENSQIDWAKYQPSKPPALKAKKQLRPHQTSAKTKVGLGFEKEDRGKLIMACGTGKTFTSLKIAEETAGKNKLVLFLVPSLNLLSQSLTEWTQESGLPLHSFAVCSDAEVGKKRDKNDEDIVETFAHELRYPATTDAKRLAFEVTKRHDAQHMSVIFSTYHSLDVISRAQQKFGLPVIDLVICDEAHRTTGATFSDSDDKESNFVRVHDNAFLAAKKRLYMTATPRIYSDAAEAQAEKDNATLYGMNKEEWFGKQFHVITFSEAVELKLLTDYKVLVLAVSEDVISKRLSDLLKHDNELRVDDAARIVGCWKALSKQGVTQDLAHDPEPMKRAVAFCQVIEKQKGGKTHKVSSKHIAGMFKAVVDAYQAQEDSDNDLLCDAEHVDGTMNAAQKEEKLAWLKAEPPANTCRILSNVRCLSEGVDVPALDAVLFLTPRNSQVDVVQSVGRVMRTAPGKQLGYVILPVVIPHGFEPHEALNDNKTYKVVWDVLQALRSHDDRFDAFINRTDLVGPDPRKMEVIAITDKIAKKSKKTKSGPGEDAKGGHTIGQPVTGGGDGMVQGTLKFEVGELERALYAKMVKKCGNPNHWEDWADDIAKIANTHISRITAIVGDPANKKEVAAFNAFAGELRDDLNDSITDSEVIEMLAQHLITKPVFDALFEDYSFASQNPVSMAMQGVLDVLHEHRLEKEADTLEKFYASVARRAEGIDNAEGKQKIVVELYNNFFSKAFPLLKKRLGIVYTPVQVVDFIIHSINDLLQSEFGQTLGSKGVHIIDPFTGTGTFVTRLLQSGLIKPEELPYKYKHEIHANEIVLLAYYIAAINIEAVYHSLLKDKGTKYQPFEGICLTDTFQMYEKDDLVSVLMEHNSARRTRQKKLDIRVIMANPPYSSGDKDDEDNKNVAYASLDERIATTYVAESAQPMGKSKIYDSYIRAIRWASDRIGKSGIVGYVTNAGFLEANTADGLRKCLVKEFSSIYVFHLRGNQRTSGEVARKEGGKIFGGGSRAPIAITFLVKNPEAQAHGKIFWHDIGDYLTQVEKLSIITQFGSTSGISAANGWRAIIPDIHNDWTKQREGSFGQFIPIGDKKDKSASKVFESYSMGVKSNRDDWVYNYSKGVLSGNVLRMTSFFNSEVKRLVGLSDDEVEKQINRDKNCIKWTSDLIAAIPNASEHRLIEEDLRPSVYRPFSKQWSYFNRSWNWTRHLMPAYFPTTKSTNLVISVTGIGETKGFSALIADICPNLHFVAGGQCFPLYLYEKATDDEDEGSLFAKTAAKDTDSYTRRDGISDAGLAHFQAAYPTKGEGDTITKEALFYYIYGLLHSPYYRSRYADNLGKELPRIPAVKRFADFAAFSKAGRDLAHWHLNYETVAPYAGVTLDTGKHALKSLKPEDYRVEKMKFAKTRDPETNKSINDKTTVFYNAHITLRDIPEEAYAYIVNGKPALEWVMERQGIKEDPDSGIVNDANLWATETMNNPKYPLELFLRVITVSLETMKIVDGLPKLDI